MARIVISSVAALLVAISAAPAVEVVEDPPPTLRLVSYNIKHCRGVDGVVDLARIAAVLKRLNPDLVALQEVDQRCTRSGNVDQAAELGRRLGMEHRFGKFMEFQGGDYGLAVLSRLPISDSTRHVLAPGGEPRCALEVVVQPEGFSTPLSFVSIHNDWTSEKFRVAQVRDLLAGLETRNHPVFLAGDFNARPASPSLRLLVEAQFTFVDKLGAKTFPSPEPRVEIDHFLARQLPFEEPPRSTVHDERVASDHRPIVAIVTAPQEDK